MSDIKQIQCKMSTQLGSLYLVASARGLMGVSFTKQALPLTSRPDKGTPEGRVIHMAMGQLTGYLAGTRTSFDLPLIAQGTPFQSRVWKELSRIPFGKTASYGDIAVKIKNPKAVRAVGSANGKNPLCIVIPCHRVIAADGSIGGYSGGIRIKRKLLDHEIKS